MKLCNFVIHNSCTFFIASNELSHTACVNNNKTMKYIYNNLFLNL